MVTFELNGRVIQTDADKDLLSFLRKKLEVISAVSVVVNSRNSNLQEVKVPT